MLKAVHFGAGNIGRGFIGEILSKNGFEIGFVDINDTIIDELNNRKEYLIEIADENQEKIKIENVYGINSSTHPQDVIDNIAAADIVTTAIGPNILPYIAELIAKGIKQRRVNNNTNSLDVIACENMIGGSQFLYDKVSEYLGDDDLEYVNEMIGFPNAAVDRIVPIQHHDDPLFVSVEPFCEWVVDESTLKNEKIELDDVEYVSDLEPYIERKLFSVNTGHATVAYTGASKGYKTILEAISDMDVLEQLKHVLSETGNLLVDKWGFDKDDHKRYIEKIIKRFENPYISDDISRVARTPIRKLGYNERFICPTRELKERGLAYNYLIDTVSKVLHYQDKDDEQSVELQEMIKNNTIEDVIRRVTGLEDEHLINQIKVTYEKN
ncbi:mannitol-1-phosphate 5-dehydrogenase [Vagococcus jeotgali]|uniref:mannitol-1-phosphate 5-dehydrogenase n=1 Tax=Vagococcus jeotgali TaxID=3109030 RepID=UPI002DD7BF0D|nr:mannitol-1-phosphate 5-dehydrogenase [Vagococcus sp. B2T-5]